MTDVLFYIAAVVAVVSALLVVTRRNPVHSALSMLPLIGALALLFLLHRASFVAAMQVMVYGGAVVVVFLFVIMLVVLRPENLTVERAMLPKLAAAVGAVLMGGLLYCALIRDVGTTVEAPGVVKPATEVPKDFGTVKGMAQVLFGKGSKLTAYTVAFELVSLLIVVAIVGAVMISKPEQRAKSDSEKKGDAS